MQKIQNLKVRFERWRLSRMPLEDRFNYLYARGRWYSNRETRSGAGSTLEATEGLRGELPHVLDALFCKRLLDLGCGDFNWMRHVALPCDYTGCNIVRGVIEENIRVYGSERIQFL